MNNRIDWIDALRGMGIILVVWGHLNVPFSVETIIYSFHMPLFFFISGYLYKESYRSFYNTVNRKTTTLLIPYLIFALISIPIGIMKDFIMGHTLINISKIFASFLFLNGTVGWNSPIWFLIVLFITELMIFGLAKTRINAFIWIIIFLLIGYFISYTSIEYPFGLQIVCFGVVFYLIGFLCKKYYIIEKINCKSLNFIGSLILFGTVNLFFGVVLNQRISVYHNELGNYWYFIVSAIAGSLFITIIFSRIPVSKILVRFGENTLLILATQYMVFLIIKAIDQLILETHVMEKDSYIISLFFTAITMIIYLPLSLFVNKYFPITVGKKRKISH